MIHYKQFGGHILRRAKSDLCDLESFNQIITPPDRMSSAAEAAAAAAAGGSGDEMEVQLAVQQRRSGSGGRPDSVVDFDGHLHTARTSSALIRDQVGTGDALSFFEANVNWVTVTSFSCSPAAAAAVCIGADCIYRGAIQKGFQGYPNLRPDHWPRVHIPRLPRVDRLDHCPEHRPKSI